MTLRLLLILAAVGQWKLTHLVSISGRISKDVTFIHEVFPVPSAKRAIIEYEVHFNSIYDRGLTMGIYTTQDHANIQNQCTKTRYGQLGNKQLHPAMNTDLRTCNKKGIIPGEFYCRDRISVQDFMPRSFSFSIGFECFYINHRSRFKKISLIGLVYNVSISGQTNRTDCASNWGNDDNDTEICHFESVAATNLLGNKLSHSKDTVNILKTFYSRTAAGGKTSRINAICYQHFIETACHILLPPCEPDTGLVIRPCKEACYDMINMCKHDPDMENIFGNLWEFDCDYLPSSGDGTLCFYKPVTCYKPSPIKHVGKWADIRPLPSPRVIMILNCTTWMM